mmetsp:Transcript_8535/g.14167  ORF Transcript_8535/g.14167 Transcript_8535/m.14167 type:complete len:749 (-) Transcript_8535:122-2368(-)|eukprot:CAMPEP_0119011588 /NCGR_PEP_ID=MMETSP1176-20130426/5769_1 /TAXON_ID=265551 /ORGANISM="Synedropsis recta cf, Strain CCMP1620" /LENGTH=748 /DNA_ID=CAMNT_0006964437 /DNA_START=143 /DNA_END=2389 /DNA_ORIENTATION=+
MSSSSPPVVPPNPKQAKWDYLNSLESSPKMSRWEYLNSLDNNKMENAESIRIPNIAPTDFGGETFYNEPIDNSKSSLVSTGGGGGSHHPVSNSKYRVIRWFQDRSKLFLMTCAGLILIAIIVMSTTLGGNTNKSSSANNKVTAADTASLAPSEILYLFNDEIKINVKTTAAPKPSYWIGLWQSTQVPGDVYTISDVPPAMWLTLNACEDEDEDNCTPPAKEQVVTFSENTKWQSDYTIAWPLCNGKWTACVIDEETLGNLGCSDQDFAVYGGNCDGVCQPATESVSSEVHLNPTPGAAVSKIAFGSCFEPGNQIDGKLWDHMRQTFQPDLWVWLGDNAYADGEDLERKRSAYNLGKSDPFYKEHGPLAEPKIPVTGTWDDHDSGSDNTGAEYQCHKGAQDEFAYWFNLPESDPRHPAQGSNQQHGVYSSLMFSKPGAPDVNGVHLVMLDVRTSRSPTFEENGYCQEENSTVLGDAQWEWLEAELQEKSKIKVIATGMQVMQPTDQLFNDVESYCANDGDTFFNAIDDIEEDKRWLGTRFEGWQQIPQEKVRLMKLLQKTINSGKAEKIVIISGDMHWGEMMAKAMPPHAETGDPAQVLYEVTASGIDKNWPTADFNANRIRVRSADTQGDGVYQRECKFPFRYKGKDYNDCVDLDQDALWCALEVDADMKNEYVTGQWGNCMAKELELVPRANITSSGENSCQDRLHVCSARANYGGIEVDWDNNVMKLSIFTPHANDPVAAEVRIGF